MSQASISLDKVMSALKSVQNLNLSTIKDLKINGDVVSLKVVIGTTDAQTKLNVQTRIKEALTQIAGATHVDLAVEVQVPKSRQQSDKRGIPGIKNIIAVSSGKGGVGKSTVAVNLSCALSQLGFSVGLLDSDVYGPNVPTMMGVGKNPPQARQDEQRGEVILPEQAHGVKIMSMGILTQGDQPLVWRGPMLHGVISQFLMKVDWQELDFLIVDMPPGTGDVQLSLTQLVPVSGAVVVTTPQEVSLQDVRKAVLMFEKVGVPVLGIVENMSFFKCDQCDKRHEIFGSGGGAELAKKFRTKLLAELPLESAVRQAGDSGMPVVVAYPESVQAKAFLELAKTVAHEVGEMSARYGTVSGAPSIEISGF